MDSDVCEIKNENSICLQMYSAFSFYVLFIVRPVDVSHDL